jgi:hypothetical protein
VLLELELESAVCGDKGSIPKKKKKKTERRNEKEEGALVLPTLLFHASSKGS